MLFCKLINKNNCIRIYIYLYICIYIGVYVRYMAKILHFLKDHIPQFSHRLLVEKNLRKYL